MTCGLRRPAELYLIPAAIAQYLVVILRDNAVALSSNSFLSLLQLCYCLLNEGSQYILSRDSQRGPKGKLIELCQGFKLDTS